MARDYIDLMGPDGNAFALMAIAKDLLRQMGEDREYIKGVMEDMRSGDYHNLLEVLVEEVGGLIEIVGLEEYGIEGRYRS